MEREAFHQLKRLQQNQRPLLRQINMSCLITNALRYGLVTMSLGASRGRGSIPHGNLTVRDFPFTSVGDFDNYVPAADDKLEKPGKAPVPATAWMHQGGWLKSFGCFVGGSGSRTRSCDLVSLSVARKGPPLMPPRMDDGDVGGALVKVGPGTGGPRSTGPAHAQG